MSTTHNSLSPHADKRLRGGELILKGCDNETIADIVEVPPPPSKMAKETQRKC
jgi:hypothetical protein